MKTLVAFVLVAMVGPMLAWGASIDRAEAGKLKPRQASWVLFIGHGENAPIRMTKTYPLKDSCTKAIENSISSTMVSDTQGWSLLCVQEPY